MKNIKYLIAFTAAAILLSGCVKQMDIQKDDRAESHKSVYTSLARAYEHLMSSYYIPVYSGPQAGFSADGHMLAAYCDEAQEVWQASPVRDWYDGRVSSSKMPLWWIDGEKGSEHWAGLFHCIDGCNTALFWLEKEDLVTDYGDAQRKGMVAQYYALRAYCYLQLIKRWGGVPIVERPIDKDHDYSGDTRASFAACVDFIISSCDQALAATDDLSPDGLPWFAAGSSPWQKPRLGRAAIWAIKSQAALYAASPLWADDNAGTGKYTWQRTVGICKRALDEALTHGAALVSPATAFPAESSAGVNAYDKYFLASYPWSRGWDTETLWQPFHYGYLQSQVWKNSGLPIDPGQISAGACPTQNMVDAYEVVSADGTTSVPLLDLATPYNDDGTPNINPAARALGYVDCTEKMYLNRDPRFYATIYYDGAPIELSSGKRTIRTALGVDYTLHPESVNCALDLSSVNRRNTCTGYYLRKFSNAASGAEHGNNDGYMRNFRLADLYLNFAEAAYHAGGADDSFDSGIPNTNPMTAREAVNAIRARVGMPAIGNEIVDKGFELRLLNERRVELAFEEHRFFDVRRLCEPGKDLSKTDKRVSGICIEEKNGSRSYTRFFHDRNCYTPKYLKYPLQLDEVRKMLTLTGKDWQNEGWD